jgi:single-stranded-DNA-specific exonuclease
MACLPSSSTSRTHARPDLLVTVDNGIASLEGVARAKQLGIATLITDHHLPGDALPQADCIVNPNQPACAFPSKALAGVGVMFYVMLALRAELRRRGRFAGKAEPNLGTVTDLVALGTVADVVPLDANNRILVAQGLKRLRSGRGNPGLVALLRIADVPPPRQLLRPRVHPRPAAQCGRQARRHESRDRVPARGRRSARGELRPGA